jgi:hypothetical protein
MVNGEVQGIANLASGQLEGAQSLHATSGNINNLAELLLLAVGNFRFAAHREAQDLMAGLLPALISANGKREDLELQIATWLERNPCFELAYITDGEGRQIVDNLSRDGDRLNRDASARGRNWSDRPWFKEAVRCQGIHSTDIYRSTANHSFCFTVFTALRDKHGRLLHVFGADVNFQRLVTES